MARSSVLDARRGWIRSTGPARHGSGRSSAPLRSHRSRPPVAHRKSAALSRTSTTFRGGVPSPPGAFVADSFMVCRASRSLRSRALPEGAELYRAHARRQLTAQAPRARASTSPGTADGRELGALKHGSLASGYRRWRANRGDIGKPERSPRGRHMDHARGCGDDGHGEGHDAQGEGHAGEAVT